MFGYRHVREDDYDRLITSIRTLADKIDAQQAVIDSLRERLIDAEGTRRSAQTMRDGLITRVNQLEEESAVLRNKLTGLPQIAPKIEKGSPLLASNIGANVDLFQDVGDAKARELHDSGLLHEDDMQTDQIPFPSARSLTDHLQ